jgi:hypothetical protein
MKSAKCKIQNGQELSKRFALLGNFAGIQKNGHCDPELDSGEAISPLLY